MKRILAAVGLSVAGLAGTAHANTLTYDVADDFSTTQNANGVWSYGLVDGDTFTVLSNSGRFGAFPTDPDYDGWQGADIFTGVFDAGDTYLNGSVNPDQILLHPGPLAGQAAAVQFTADVAGTYDFSGLFEAGDVGGTETFVLAETGATTALGALIDTGDTAVIDLTRTLDVGQSVVFFVTRGEGDTYFNDGVFLSLTVEGVSEVPLPAALPLFALGLGGLASIRRRA